MKSYVCIEGENLRVVAQVPFDPGAGRFCPHIADLKVERNELDAMGGRAWVKDSLCAEVQLEEVVRGLIEGKLKLHQISELDK